MSKAPCRFFNKPGGCRSGDNCRFSHNAPTLNYSRPAPTGSPSAPTQSEGGGVTSSIPQVPPGTCRYYWLYGNCKRGFDCRYKHDQASNVAVSSTTTTANISSPSTLFPFLTAAGAAKLLDPGSDVLFGGAMRPRSPSEVHNFLKMYLRDGYQFRNALDMYSFLALLTNATSTNNSWVREFSNPRQVQAHIDCLRSRRQKTAR